jgi:hypothetical protein
MLTLRRPLLAGSLIGSLLGIATTANATSIETVTTPFTGTDTAVRVVLSEEGGDIRVTATVTLGLADLRGVYLDIGNDALLDGMSASGEFVTSYQFDANGVINLGHGSNLRGGGTPCPCDIGVELGTPGIGKDDILSTSFLLHSSSPLSLADFAEQLVGVRVTSVGPDSDSRGGSAKLAGTLPDGVPVPEPTPGLLTAAGLGALSYYASRRQRRR